MFQFCEWFFIESVEDTVAWAQEILKRQVTIPPEALNLIVNALKAKNKDDKSFAQYLFGFYAGKPDARPEDYDRAADNYDYFKRTKDSPQWSEFTDRQPFSLGKQDSKISAIKSAPQSRSQQKRMATKGTTSDGRVIIDSAGRWTLYTIPAARDDAEEQENGLLYCKYGKGTQWCTAAVGGTYYKHYAKHLDITVVNLDGKPVYQFGLNPGGSLNDELSQFMDAEDYVVEAIPLDLYEYLANSRFKEILNLEDLKNMKRYILTKNVAALEYKELENYAVVHGLKLDDLKEEYKKQLYSIDIEKLAKKFYIPGKRLNDKVWEVASFDDMDGLVEFLDETPSRNTKYLSDIENFLDIDFNVSQQEVRDAVDNLDKDIYNKLVDYADTLKPADVTDEEWEDMDLYEILRDYDEREVLDVVWRALHDGYSVGTQELIYRNAKSQLLAKDVNGFYVDLDVLAVLIHVKDLYDLIYTHIEESENDDEVSIDVNQLIKIEYDPNNRDSDFSRRAFEEYLRDNLLPILN